MIACVFGDISFEVDGREYYFGIDGNGRNRDAILNTDSGFFTKNIQFNQDMIFVNQLSGLHTFDEEFELTWGVGYNKVFSNQPDRKRFALENYNLALDNDPSTNPSFYNNTNFDNQRYFQNIEDEELNSRLNLEYTVSDNFKLNFGYNGRTKERFFKNIRYGYDLIAPNTPVEDINNLDSIFKPVRRFLGVDTPNSPTSTKIIVLPAVKETAQQPSTQVDNEIPNFKISSGVRMRGLVGKALGIEDLVS